MIPFLKHHLTKNKLLIKIQALMLGILAWTHLSQIRIVLRNFVIAPAYFFTRNAEHDTL